MLTACIWFGLLPAWFTAPGLYFILRVVVKYRLKVVRDNLANSFPDKSAEELRDIERKFYWHLSNVVVDTAKLSVISRRKILERMTYTGIKQHEESLRGRSWIAAMSHFGSWELTVNYAMLSDHRLLAVYRPLHSPVMDMYYRHSRSRFGTHPVSMKNIWREVIKASVPGSCPVAVALIADQTPPRPQIDHWYDFFDQPTPFFSGMEKMAVRFGMPVYFTYIRKTSPRSYEAEFRMIYDGSEKVEEFEITSRYVAMLEDMIRQTPQLWMWSHRRWKHKPAKETETETKTQSSDR